MKRAEVERQVMDILRYSALAGSQREVSLEATLGLTGLGLDSLGLAEFVTALEKTFQVSFSDGVWADPSRHNLKDFVDLIVQLAPARPPGKEFRLPPSPLLRAQVSKVGKLRKVIAERGWWEGLLWASGRLLDPAIRQVWERKENAVLACDLGQQVPELPASLDLSLRVVSAEDAPAVSDFWAPEEREEGMRRFWDRLALGYLCLAAWHESRIVGLDWISATGDDDSQIGTLKIRLRPGACYGLNLLERRSYEGRSVGLALLAFSLQEAKKRGFQTQFTIVSAGNLKMMNAAIHLLGF